jgi:hypothetical protein
MNDRNADLLQSITTGNAGIQSTPLRPTYEEVVPEIMVRPMHSFVTGESSSQMRYVYKIASPPAEMRTVAICLDRGQPGSREFHPDIFHTQSPTLLALGWGVVATWWVSLFLGIMLAIAARSRSRVKLTASHIFPLLLKLLAIIAIFALAAGIIGYFLQGLGMEYYATAIQKQIRHTFYAALWAHEMSYPTGLIGGITLSIIVWRSRRTQGRRETLPMS